MGKLNNFRKPEEATAAGVNVVSASLAPVRALL